MLNVELADTGKCYAVNLENGVLTYVAGNRTADAGATLRLPTIALAKFAARLASLADLQAKGAVTTEGDAATASALFDLIDTSDTAFAIVEP